MSKRSATRAARERMVATQLVDHGIRQPAVLEAMRNVQREEFVGPESEPYAYEDRPLAIGAGQTISQPYIVAFMIEALQLDGGEKVLEIGGGSGYAAAILARIAATVFTIECIPELAGLARRNLAASGIANVTVRCGDGTEGWPEQAPFDAILVSAGAPDIPAALVSQLKVGGRMVIPVGHEPTSQDLVRVVRNSTGGYYTEYLTGVRFVPLIGSQGWTPGTT